MIGAAALSFDALNALDQNAITYLAGDSIDIVGTELDGTAVSKVFQWGLGGRDGTTLGDLRDFVSVSFGSATATIDWSGNIVLTADAPGPASLALTISDSSGNTGSTIHPGFAITTTGSGDVYITTIPIFDTLGISHIVTLTFNKTTTNTWNLTPTMRSDDGTVTDAITGIYFNSNGSFASVTGTSSITITYPNSTVQTISFDFGTPNAFSGLVQFGGTSSAAAIDQDGYGYGSDAFVTKINSTGSAIIYSTFLGGSRGENSNTITVDNFGNAYIIGHTDSNDFPITTGSYDTSYNGNGDAFVAKLSIGEQPVPDINANSSDGPVSINTDDNLSVTVELDSGERTGEDADWWVVVETPFDWYHYDVPSDSWVPDLTVTLQSSLFDLPPFEVLSMSGLPPGIYTLYFGVDMVMNGALDMSDIFYDSVIVNITE